MYDPNDLHDFNSMTDETDARKRTGHAVAVHCYQCTAGCVHFEFGHLTLTFTPQQFLTVSAAIAATRSQLLAEEDLSMQVADTVVM